MLGNRDNAAAALLRELREERGLSPEQVPFEMYRAGIDRRFIPSARTIRRIEIEGVVPQIRFKFGLATFYGREVSGLWRPSLAGATNG